MDRHLLTVINLIFYTYYTHFTCYEFQCKNTNVIFTTIIVYVYKINRRIS